MFLETNGREQKAGWIEVICGSMFSGKTEELIRRIRRAEIARQKTVIFKPAIDVRYAREEVVSHDKKAVESIPVESSQQILLMLGDAEVVGIDEAQFFDSELPNVCTQLANAGMRVIIAGLDMDFLGNPFGPMPALMAIAEYVTKVHAICMRCGALAQFSHRTVPEENIVMLGETDTYEPLCRACFIKATENNEP